MYQNCHKKSKQNITNSRPKSETLNKPSIESVKVTTEKKKECSIKALDIVTLFSDGTINETCLLNNIQFINQEHYQDIIEERAISKQCGYPLCKNSLGSIPSKQYHISTSHNKVFDITDRKNFCSNLCYKASKFLKDQIPTSPLWLRDGHTPNAYKLISLQSRGGTVGDEVDLGVTFVKVEVDDNLPYDGLKSKAEHHPNKCSSSPQNKPGREETTRIHHINHKVETCVGIGNNEQITNNNSFSSETNNDGLKNAIPEPSFSQGNENSEQLVKSRDLSNDLDNKVKTSDAINDVQFSCKPDVHLYSDMKVKEYENITSNTTNYQVTKLIGDKNVTITKSLSKPPRKSSKTKSSSTVSDMSPFQNIVKKIEHILREWFSVNSLCFLFGEEKVKEILSEKRSVHTHCFNDAGTSVNGHLYDRYLDICKKLNILELEDKKADASFKEEIKKPLPDYEMLKEESKKMELKVKMFYKGDKVVHFKELQEEPTNSESDYVTQDPILPLVDLHAQKALRRRIVVDKLRKILQDLQISLGLRGFNLSEDIRTLIGTFTLSAHNITMKPAEWNLIAIVIIKLLSLKDESLEQALSSTTSNKHLTLLLLSYSLDTGYLNRLIIWLTDLELILQTSE